MTALNPHIFRSYDIRGLADRDLPDSIAYLMGKGFGTYSRLHLDGGTVAVGHDCRLSSPRIEQAFIQGLIDSGCSVFRLGQVTSPMVYFAACVLPVNSAVAITASHNPKEYNGFKFVAKNAHSVCGEELQILRNIIETQAFSSPQKATDSNSDNDSPTIQTVPDLFSLYLAEITGTVKLNRPLKIVVDAGNGATADFCLPFFTSLGCQVIPLYCEPDGNFPNHEANPEVEANLADLIAAVREHKADLGLGFDGDGDRVGIVDENGKHYHADQLLLLLARDLLDRHPGAKIVFDVKCSKILENDIRARGGIPVICKTGHSHIESKLRETGALLGGEVSGHLFFAENYYGYDDAFFAAAKILQILSRTNQPFSALLEDLPVLYNTPEIKAACPDERKFAIVEELQKHFTADYECLTLDGVRVHFDSESWGIVRCSNTSPNLTLRFEAPTPKRLKEIMAVMISKLRDHPEISLDWYDDYL